MSRSARNRREEEARLAREVAARAIRRLDLLEWVMLGMVAVLALGGGAVIAWLLQAMVGTPFRPTWIVASVLLFAVPGAISLKRLRSDERETRERVQELIKKSDG